MLIFVIGFVGLGLLAAIAWRQHRRRADDARLAEIAFVGMSRARYPHVYVGPDTRYGLRRDTPCRITNRRAGNVVRVMTPDGRGWNVADRQITRRNPSIA